MRASAAALVCIAATLASPALASEKGWFGVGFNVSTTGIWNPAIEAVTLKVVAPGSAAEGQKLMVGDAVLELNGIPVPGAKGEQIDRLKEWMNRKTVVGDTLTLKLSREGTGPFTVILTATRRPE